MDIELTEFKLRNLHEIGIWLDKEMPNYPLPLEQRWTIGIAEDGERFGVKFLNNKDAIMFSLRWL